MAHFGNHWFQEIFSSVTKYLLHKFIVIHSVSASPRARGGAAGPSPLSYIEIKKRNSYFVDWMIKKNILRDLLFSRNQPPKSADG
jgi:hypothetical protein